MGSIADFIRDETEKYNNKVKLHNANAEKANREIIEKNTGEKLKKLKPLQSPEQWLQDIAENSRQCMLATHVGKFTSPAAKVNVFSDLRMPESKGYVCSMNTNCRYARDIVASGAFSSTTKFLFKELEDGRPVLEHLEGNTEEIKSELSGFTDDYEGLRGSLLGLRKPAIEDGTDWNVRQVYFPLGNGEYQILTPLTSSPLLFEIKRRVREIGKKQYELYEKGPRAFSGITAIAYGGEQPQNISCLNFSNGGEGYLLPSVPPVIEKQYKRTPKYNFFRECLFKGYFKHEFEQLKQLVDSEKNNVYMREKVKYTLSDIIDKVVYCAAGLQTLPAGWTNTDRCKDLPDEQKLWLDAGNNAKRLESEDWAVKVAKAITAWVIRTFGSLYKSRIISGDIEFDFIYDIAFDALGGY